MNSKNNRVKCEYTFKRIKYGDSITFSISSVYHGNKPWVAVKNRSLSRRNYNNHVITVKNTQSGKYIRFEYWASQRNPQIERETDLLEAFKAIVTDSLAYLESESEEGFCDEFSTNHRTYMACEKATMKLAKILGNDPYGWHGLESDVVDLSDALEEHIDTLHKVAV